PESRVGKKFSIRGLQHGKFYLVTFYDTRIARHQLSTQTVRSNRHGIIHFAMPDVPDCAFKVILSSSF
ncbi:MAG TPA: hypothetical protein VFJ43_17830, partial [Bacteroidia bacterium]|nr:hypothetical protein [Bacteroidia bacterium]